MGKLPTIITIILTFVLVIALSVFLNGNKRVEGKDGDFTYRNPVYGYSFDYPEGVGVMQYSPERVAIGQETPDGFLVLANAEVASGAWGSEDALSGAAMRLCASGDAREMVECDEVEKSESYESEKGADGRELELHLVRRDDSGNSDEERFGPVYAFGLPRGRTLFVYVPYPSTEVIAPAVRAKDIARSVALER